MQVNTGHYRMALLVAASALVLVRPNLPGTMVEPPEIGVSAAGPIPASWKKMPLIELVKRKQLTIEVNDPALRPFPRAMFDGDEASLRRSERVNPLILTFTFSEPVTLRGARLLPSHASRHDWTLFATPEARGRKIEKVAAGKWSQLELPAPIVTKIIKLEVQRVQSDDYVHVNEIELYGSLPERLLATVQQKPWPKPIPAPPGMANNPGPWSDPADLTLWPNQTSNANSDAWLVENHDKIRRMNPRVLILNVSNSAKRDHLDRLARRMIAALAEGSRYHGYKNPAAPVFLNYQVFKFVDLRDGTQTTGNSDQSPLKKQHRKSGEYKGYNGFFSEDFAKLIGVPDPRTPSRFLRLDELVDGGYIHEVWLFAEHGDGAGFEVIEQKPLYNASFQRQGNRFVQAGNGGDSDQEWTGRSIRIGHFNCSRGLGCFMESLSHGIEGLSNSKAIPYFSKYFREYAMFDLDKRYKLPFNSLYAVSYQGKNVRYEGASTMIVTHSGKEYRVPNYVCNGGSAHFPPNARNHYDLDNSQPVMSTIEDWRIGSGPGGKDLAQPWTNAAFRNYRDLAPDCMGPWLVYWRQNFPGLDNLQKDDDGKPMKNWWVFLFY